MQKKTKILKITTKEQKIKNHENLEVIVNGHLVSETKSEKLLGLIINNEMTWKEYLYGETWRPNKKDNFKGLIPKLNQRIGLLKQLRKLMKEDTFTMISNGLFNSPLIYCISVFGKVWGLGVDETNRRSKSFTKKDCQRLQVLQNKVLKLRSRKPQDYPTAKLLKELSVHQLVAYHTLLQVHKTVTTKKPKYLHDRLILQIPNDEYIFPHRQYYTMKVVGQNEFSRSGFFYRGTMLWNKLPLDLRTCDKSRIFKTEVWKWVNNNISIKPGIF